MLAFFSGENGVVETFRYIEEKLGIGLWTWDLNTNTMEWSRGIFSLLGLQPGLVAPHFNILAEMIHPDDLHSPADQSVAIRELPLQREFRIIWRNGRIRWVINKGEIVVAADKAGTRAIGIMQDVTVQHEELERLHASQQRLRALSAALNTPIWIANAASGAVTRIRNWKALGADRSNEVFGERWSDVVHPDDRDASIKAWNDARSNKKRYEREHRVRQTDGSYRWRHTCAMPVMAPDGSVKEYIGVSIDIHAAKEQPLMSDTKLMTGTQIRAARAIVHWSVRDLADHSHISPATIRRLEEIDGPVKDDSVGTIFEALKSAGVEFFAGGSRKPGVSPR